MKKILIIDDDSMFLEIIEDLLSPFNCKIIKTTDGEKAAELIETENPDLLITDIIMPEKEGIEIIIDTRKNYPDLPIIAVSGVSDEYLRMAKSLGANDTICKPIHADKLFSVVNKFL